MYLKLKELREAKGISQNSLANAVRVAPSYINRAERGNQTLSLLVAIDIADYLNCSLDELVGRKEITDGRTRNFEEQAGFM